MKKFKQLSKKKKIYSVVAIILVIGIITGGLIYAFRPDKGTEVQSTKASCETIKQTLDTSGTVASTSEGKFMTVEGAVVKEVKVKDGQIVSKGDVLATFDATSLKDVVSDKKTVYLKAKAAYNTALSQSSSSKSSISSVKKEIADLEKEISELEKETQTTVAATESSSTNKQSNIEISDNQVKLFVSAAKLLGYNYSQAQAKELLEKIAANGASLSDISNLINNLSNLSNLSSSFDMSSLASMSTSSTALMNDQMNLIQLKSQLATLQLKSNDSYASTYKAVADAAYKAYQNSAKQVEEMENDGWTADYDGIVSEINIKQGEKITASSSKKDIDISTILTAVSSGSDVSSMISELLGSNEQSGIVVQYYPLIINVDLTKYDVYDVKENQSVTIKSANDTTYSGKVSYISTVAQSSSGSISISSIMGSSSGSSSTIPAKIEIDNPDKGLIIGVDTDVSIVTETSKNATVIPVEALSIEDGKKYVYIYDSSTSTIKKSEIKIGISNDTYYEVLSGCSKDDVLVKNPNNLEDGQKVTINNDKKTEK